MSFGSKAILLSSLLTGCASEEMEEPPPPANVEVVEMKTNFRTSELACKMERPAILAALSESLKPLGWETDELSDKKLGLKSLSGAIPFNIGVNTDDWRGGGCEATISIGQTEGQKNSATPSMLVNAAAHSDVWEKDDYDGGSNIWGYIPVPVVPDTTDTFYVTYGLGDMTPVVEAVRDVMPKLDQAVSGNYAAASVSPKNLWSEVKHVYSDTCGETPSASEIQQVVEIILTDKNAGERAPHILQGQAMHPAASSYWHDEINYVDVIKPVYVAALEKFGYGYVDIYAGKDRNMAAQFDLSSDDIIGMVNAYTGTNHGESSRFFCLPKEL